VCPCGDSEIRAFHDLAATPATSKATTAASAASDDQCLDSVILVECDGAIFKERVDGICPYRGDGGVR
jgi:hypothetical protein